LCDHSDHTRLSTPGHWIGNEVFDSLRGTIGLVRCRGCSLVFTNPRPSPAALSAFYAGDTYECHDTATSRAANVKANFVLDRIEALLPSGSPRTLLDYGAGGGGFLLQVRARGWAGQAFEPGRRGLERCKRAGLQATSNLKELPSSAFGLITLHHVFEHLADPVGALHAVRRLIAPQGRVYIEVPNARSLRARLSLPMLSRTCGVDERYRAFPIHLMYYHVRTLRNMLLKGGWVVESTFTAGLGLDELSVKSAQPDRVAGLGQTHGRKRAGLKRHLRDAFLRLGLGENLAVIAKPTGTVAHG